MYVYDITRLLYCVITIMQSNDHVQKLDMVTYETKVAILESTHYILYYYPRVITRDTCSRDAASASSSNGCNVIRNDSRHYSTSSLT